MGVYDRQRATVTRLLKKYGGPIHVIRKVSSDYTPGDMTTPIDSAPEQVIGARLDDGVARAYNFAKIEGTGTIEGAVNFYLDSSLTSELMPDDILIPFGEVDRWNVIACKPLSPNGELIMYTVTAKR